MSARQTLLRGLVRASLKPLFSPRTPIRWQRQGLKLSGWFTQVPRSVTIRAEILADVAGERLEPPQPERSAVMLYLHGGGYCVGSPQSHRPITAQLARRTGLTVYAPDYRLAPEHPYPAALNDAVSAYRALHDRGQRRIVLAGDSAGGGLALATAIALRDAGLEPPLALLLFSPWTDLACSGDSMRERAARDPMLSPAALQRWAAAYLGRMAADYPLCSPLQAELAGLPPVLIQVGSDEVLLDDSRRLQARLEAAGVSSTISVHDGLWHDFQLHAGVLAQADEALAAAADFVRAQLQRRDDARIVRRA